MYRFNECTAEDLAALAKNCTRAENQVNNIITYGRRGHPDAGLGNRGRWPEERTRPSATSSST